MKVKEILTEASERAEVTAANMILRDCGPYLLQLDDPMTNRLYRGISTRVVKGFQSFFHQPNPVNRSPKDTDPQIHKYADAFFYRTTGIRFRSNATFAINNIMQATEFGQAFVIFPRGNFEICWSPEVSDMTFLGPMQRIARNLEDYIIDGELDSVSLQEDIDHVLTNCGYQTGDLQGAIRSEHEVMIYAPEGCYLVKTTEDDDEHDIVTDFYTKVARLLN